MPKHLPLTEAELDLLSEMPAVCRLCYPRPEYLPAPVAFFDVRCPLCREYHQQFSEHVCMCPLPTADDRAKLLASSSATVTAGVLLKPYPELWAFLSVTSCGQGSPRRPGNLSLRLQSGQWRMTLTDDETGLYAFLTADDLDYLFLLAEELLSKGTMPWKVSSYAAKNRKKGS